jgi:hypothetical protein
MSNRWKEGMSHYRINEGIFTLPAGFTDRSVNSFIQGEPGNSTFNLSVSRDVPLPDEPVAAYVERQLSLLKKNLKGYRLLHRQPCVLGSGEQALTGVEVYGHWKEGARAIYQRQAAFMPEAQQVLIFSATAGGAFDPPRDTQWQAWLASFR